MSEQHTEVSKKWGDPISAERQAELQGYLDRWAAETDHGERIGPFDGGQHEWFEALGPELTGAEIFWLAKQSGPDELDRVPNLHLKGANLHRADLEGASLRAVSLRHANLTEAHLETRYLNTELHEGRAI
jgi:pentapeptide repeat protein